MPAQDSEWGDASQRTAQRIARDMEVSLMAAGTWLPGFLMRHKDLPCTHLCRVRNSILYCFLVAAMPISRARVLTRGIVLIESSTSTTDLHQKILRVSLLRVSCSIALTFDRHCPQFDVEHVPNTVRSLKSNTNGA